MYVPVPPVIWLLNCVFSGVVPLVGVTLHVPVIGCIGFDMLSVPQFIVI